MTVSVKVNTKELERAFKEIERKFPTITARAINEMAAFAKSNSEKETAQRLKIPLRFVKNRFKVTGEKSGPRSRLRKANRSRQAATIDVYMRGIPVGQIAGKPTKRQRKAPGVKAKGARLYKGAFYAPGAQPHGFVFKRRANKKLMMPKVGVRELLGGHFEARISGRLGVTEFRKRWNRLANYELLKINR